MLLAGAVRCECFVLIGRQQRIRLLIVSVQPLIPAPRPVPLCIWRTGNQICGVVSVSSVRLSSGVFAALPVAVFLEQREDFAPQARLPRLDEALHVDQEASLFTVRVARHKVLHP